MMPAAPRGENGALLVDVPNRGQVWAEAIYNSPRDVRFLPARWSRAPAFFRTMVSRSRRFFWELGQGTDLPSFADADGKTRFVEGVALRSSAMPRISSPMQPSDKGGTPNPLKGAINRVLASGRSQDGRFLKTFLLNGFNMMGNRRVFDGMHVFVSAAGLLPILQTGLGPMSSAEGAPTFDNPDFPGVNDGPLTIRGDHGQGRGARRGASEDDTRELHHGLLFAARFAWPHGRVRNLRISHCPPMCECTISREARMYPPPKAPACTLTPGRLDWSPLSRALLLHLDAWVSRGTKPPASELMSLEAAGGEPPALRAPTRLSAAVIQVPKRDQDGNALGGVRLPDVAVPTGTHGGQNQPQTFTCMLIGSFSPFAATKAERERTGDARPSIEERYHGRDDYVNRIRIAAQDLLARGFCCRKTRQ
jgi:hypothetical protein